MTLPKWFHRWQERRRAKRHYAEQMEQAVQQTFTREQVERMLADAYKVGHTDGKREGIALSRQLAEQQLRRVLWEQNQNHSAPKAPTQKP